VAALRANALVLALIVLTFATGIVDAVSYLGLGRVFTANMTGNVVLFGFALGGAAGFSLPALAVSVAGFVTGAVAGGRLGAALANARTRWLLVALGAEAAFVVVAALAATGLAPDTHDPRRLLVIALLGIAMGVRNATTRLAGVADLSTTVLTQTLVGLAADSPLARGDATRWRRRLAAVVAMGLGALVGALLVRHSIVLPLFVTAALVVATGGAYSALVRSG